MLPREKEGVPSTLPIRESELWENRISTEPISTRIYKYPVDRIKIEWRNMSPDSWEKYVNAGSNINSDENTRGFHDNAKELWHMEGETLHQYYNDIRASEIKKREQEIFPRVIHFYFSRNGIIVAVISILLCLVTSTFSLEGLFLWNVVLFGIVWAYYQVTVRLKVRAEWDEIWEEINSI